MNLIKRLVNFIVSIFIPILIPQDLILYLFLNQGVSVVSLDKSLEINHLSARVEDNVEIKCDVTGSPTPPIVWKRNNIDLSILNEDEVSFIKFHNSPTVYSNLLI